MNWRIAAQIARRELRGGLRGFRVFLACLALGVAAIAAVGSVRQSIELGLQREGAVILGGDAEIQLTYRFANEVERAWMESAVAEVSEIVDFRSMAVVTQDGTTDRGLTQVKAVDETYPLYGAVVLDPPLPLVQALAGQGGVPGAVMDPVLIARLGLSVNDQFALGEQDFVLMAALLREPDGAGAGFGLGPRTIVRTDALAASGLLQPGTLFETAYRLRAEAGTSLADLKSDAKSALPAAGLRWRDSRNGAPGVSEFVTRLGAFLVLVGLAGLAVGGVGVSTAVRAYLAEKIGVIATLKTLGAESRTIFLAYAMQIGVLTLIGLVLGLTLGALAPLALAPVIEARLPVPAVFTLHLAPLGEAAIYGLLAAALFTLWPLARTRNIRAAALYREAAGGRLLWPHWPFLLASAMILAALVGSAAWFSGLVPLTLWASAGMGAVFVVLLGVAFAIRKTAARAARLGLMRGHSALRMALGSVGGPGSETAPVVLSLGLGLTVLAAIGQIDANLRGAIARDLPNVAPSYFVVDIQTGQLPELLAQLDSDAQVNRTQTAPMLRGVITQINGQPARQVAGQHWVLEGDRGITYSHTPPPGTEITAGAWWDVDYTGAPQISFAAEEAEEMGLSLGDRITINVLGRDIEAELTSLRKVDFSSAGIGFVLSMNPDALAGAPHTHIATIYADETAEGRLLREIGAAYPNITMIRVRDAISRVGEVLRGIAAATTYGALATLFTGLVVLIGTAVTGERARTYEAAILKTQGASRGTVLASFALRSAILGAAAGGVAIAAGGVAGWAIATRVMETAFVFEPISAIAIVCGGVLITLSAGLAFAWRPLATRPARVLRANE